MQVWLEQPCQRSLRFYLFIAPHLQLAHCILVYDVFCDFSFHCLSTDVGIWVDLNYLCSMYMTCCTHFCYLNVWLYLTLDGTIWICLHDKWWIVTTGIFLNFMYTLITVYCFNWADFCLTVYISFFKIWLRMIKLGDFILQKKDFKKMFLFCFNHKIN